MNLFLYSDYRAFLKDFLDTSGIYGGRGGRNRLAKAINSHLSYLTQVLKGSADISAEQAYSICSYFKFTEIEKDYFIALVERQKARSEGLRELYENRIQEILLKSKNISKRIEPTIVLQDSKGLERYYSSWIYGATHAALSLPEYGKNLGLLAKNMGVSYDLLLETVQNLIQDGIISQNEKGEFEILSKSLHLPANSPQIIQHHVNWRIKTAELIQRGGLKGVNYSSVVSLSKADSMIVQEKIIQLIKETKEIVKNSDCDEVFAFCFDFCNLV